MANWNPPRINISISEAVCVSGSVCLMASPQGLGSNSGMTKYQVNNWTSSGTLRKAST